MPICGYIGQIKKHVNHFDLFLCFERADMQYIGSSISELEDTAKKVMEVRKVEHDLSKESLVRKKVILLDFVRASLMEYALAMTLSCRPLPNESSAYQEVSESLKEHAQWKIEEELQGMLEDMFGVESKGRGKYAKAATEKRDFMKELNERQTMTQYFRSKAILEVCKDEFERVLVRHASEALSRDTDAIAKCLEMVSKSVDEHLTPQQ